MKIYWATKLRGFLRHISNCTDDIEFVQRERFYEVSTKKATLRSKIVRSKVFDPFGVFQVIKVSDKDCDGYGSYNRFLDADKPYFIYLENPTALYHYALGRIKYPLGRKRFEKLLNDPNLRYIVCLSDACRETFERINMTLPESVRCKTIYPMIPKNRCINEELIHKKSYAETLECLYCVQGKSFYTKGGRDILEAVVNLCESGYKIHLTVITNINALNEETIKLIKEHDEISLYDFNFTYEQLEHIYARTAVLVQPSSADSFGLTVLEAMKGGCAVLGSKLYAFSEMIEHNGNGLLIDPMYWTFTPDNLPNPLAWGYDNKVRLSSGRSQRYIDDIELALKAFCEDRDKLCEFSKRSLEIANTKFGEDTISEQWKDVWESLKG